MLTEDQVFKQHLSALLTYHPNQHIIKHVLDKMDGLPDYHGFSIGRNLEVEVDNFLAFEKVRIDKLKVNADISLFDTNGKHFKEEISNCHFEFYIAIEEQNWVPDSWLLLSLDDLLFYLNRLQNEQAIEENQFPKLTSCELGGPGFNYINRGRAFCNQYFSQYTGPVFHLYYGNEFNELFAIATNALAFLYRSRDRVMEEIDLMTNYNYRASLNLYPRFNNAIAEVAGTIYAAWERIGFLLNEFYPSSPNSGMAPSFKRYISDKVKEAKKDKRLLNVHLQWFENRINNSHAILENLRHPTVHYNKSRTPSGTRAVELMKTQLDTQGVLLLKQTWSDDLAFLKRELEVFNDALEQAILLLECWAVSV